MNEAMVEPVVSLIVPVYRTEPFLARCLDSLLGQTLGQIEVLAVDDASPDGAAAVLASYAGRDSGCGCSRMRSTAAWRRRGTPPWTPRRAAT